MTATLTSFDRARAYVAKIPGAVQGNHGDCQTLAVANVLVWDFALSPTEALIILREYNSRCSPSWADADLIRKLQSAEKQSHAKPRGNLLDGKPSSFQRPSAAPKPRVDPASAVENYLRGFRCDEADLWEASAIRPPDDWTTDALALLASLYLPGELVNVVTAFKADTKPDGSLKANPAGFGDTLERDKLIALFRERGTQQSEAGGWLRMNPVDRGGTADANVTAFRFALIECDAVPVDLQLSLLAKLPLPTAAILTSGGRSLHAWVRVDAASAEAYRQTVARMLALLSKFGVDGANKNPSRLSRLPGVTRTIGAAGDGRQRLLYLNPSPKQKAIL